VIWSKRVASMHLHFIISKEDNVHKFINIHDKYYQQTNDIINSD